VVFFAVAAIFYKNKSRISAAEIIFTIISLILVIASASMEKTFPLPVNRPVECQISNDN